MRNARWGFATCCATVSPISSIVAEREVQEDAGRAYDEVRALLADHADLLAIYCIGAGQDGVARALVETGRDKTIFIGHDLTDGTRSMLLSGVMDAAIDQNAHVEAREAVDRLVRAIRGEGGDRNCNGPHSIGVSREYPKRAVARLAWGQLALRSDFVDAGRYQSSNAA